MNEERRLFTSEEAGVDELCSLQARPSAGVQIGVNATQAPNLWLWLLKEDHCDVPRRCKPVRLSALYMLQAVLKPM